MLARAVLRAALEAAEVGVSRQRGVVASRSWPRGESLPHGARYPYPTGVGETAEWHWLFIGQPAPLAERLITAAAEAWYHLDRP